MQIKELWVYPVKSLAGTAVEQAALAKRGFVDDRRWMLVDENGRFISQRQHAHLARWQASVQGDDLIFQHLDTGKELMVNAVRAEDGPLLEVEVWNDRFAARLVESATMAGLPLALGMDCRLVYLAKDSYRPLDPRYAQGKEEVSFADGYPYLIANESSLVALSTEVGEELNMRRFRPNIVLEGAAAFAEDDWKQLQVGTQVFRLPKPCARCIVITIDPDTTTKNPTVFRKLAEIHSQGKKVLFGMNACWEGKSNASLKVGEAVSVIK